MRFVAALLYAVSGAVLLGCALAFAGHGLTDNAAWMALAGGATVGVWALWRERARPFAWPQMDVWDGAALTIFALFALRSFLWLSYRHGDHLVVLSPNNAGDLALHITYVRLFAAGAPFWPENPIFSGHPLTYPIGMDFFNALLVRCGMDILRAFIWVGLAASVCAAAALWKWGRAFVVAGFLFAGGLWGFAFFHRWILVDYQSDFAWGESAIVAWKSLPLAIFVTQRGMLFALPAGLLLLASWRARFFESSGTGHHPAASPPLPLWGEILLYATMPIFHLHTFLFLSIIAATWFVALSAARRHLGTVVAVAFIPATVQVWWVTGGLTGTSMIGWKPGWMQGSEGFLAFWLRNFGILPILVGALIFSIVRRRRWHVAIMVAPALGIFLICCFVKFAPWEWDNTKLMLWSYLIILPPLWNELMARWPEWAHATFVPLLWSELPARWPRRLRIVLLSLWNKLLAHGPEAAQAIACFILFFSGAISLFGGLGGGYANFPIATRSELDGLGVALAGIPITERFVAHPTHNHPLLLNGRVLAMGYVGHVASHGLEWAPREQAVKTILEGKDGWRETAQELGVRYLFWGREEEENYPDSKRPWLETTRSVVRADWGEIFDLTRGPKKEDE